MKNSRKSVTKLQNQDCLNPVSLILFIQSLYRSQPIDNNIRKRKKYNKLTQKFMSILKTKLQFCINKDWTLNPMQP